MTKSAAKALPQGSPEFDRALASAISRGESPAKAIVTAQQVVKNLPKDVQTASTSLASGKNMDSLLSSPGNSRTFKTALGNALAKGMPVEKALAMARKAEAANSFKFPLSGTAARIAGARNMQVTTADGKPLPAWLRYVPESRSFVASDVPEGAFPLRVVLSSAGQKIALVIAEGSVKK